ncbi:TPA: 50S ribosomal protein L35 [bacterium]|nr:50S ribosomal protein L35 [bacterium]
MPKIKTHKGAAKRFKKTGSGRFKRSRAFGSHLLTKKDSCRKRRLCSKDFVDSKDKKKIKALLPYS